MPRSAEFQGIKLRSCGGGNDAATLDAFFAKRKIAVPADYRQFLLQVNGGKPSPAGFRYPGFGSVADWPERQQAIYLQTPSPEERALTEAIYDIAAYVRDTPTIESFCKLKGGDESLSTMLSGLKPTTKPDVSSLIPIAMTSDYVPLWMSLAEIAPGSIYAHSEDFFLAPGTPADPLSEFSDLLVAPSFSELLAGLHPPEQVVKPGFELTEVHRKALLLQRSRR